MVLSGARHGTQDPPPKKTKAVCSVYPDVRASEKSFEQKFPSSRKFLPVQSRSRLPASSRKQRKNIVMAILYSMVTRKATTNMESITGTKEYTKTLGLGTGSGWYTGSASNQYTGVHQYTGRSAGALQNTLIYNVAPSVLPFEARRVEASRLSPANKAQQSTSLPSSLISFSPLSSPKTHFEAFS